MSPLAYNFENKRIHVIIVDSVLSIIY